jgi:hypothetical protein
LESCGTCAKTRADAASERCVKPFGTFVGDWKIRNKWRDPDALVFSTDQIVDYFDRQQPELMSRETTNILRTDD